MISAPANLDYYLIKSATDWTAGHAWAQSLVYICAEILIFIFPLCLMVLWMMPEIRSKKHGAQKAVIMAVMTMVIALAVKAAISYVWLRARPFVAYPELYSMSFRVDQPSFPSSHAMISFAIAASIAMSGYRKLGGWLLTAAVLVGLGRVFSGVHYPSDVLMGALLGILIAWYMHREASSLKRYLPND